MLCRTRDLSGWLESSLSSLNKFGLAKFRLNHSKIYLIELENIFLDFTVKYLNEKL